MRFIILFLFFLNTTYGQTAQSVLNRAMEDVLNEWEFESFHPLVSPRKIFLEKTRFEVSEALGEDVQTLSNLQLSYEKFIKQFVVLDITEDLPEEASSQSTQDFFTLLEKGAWVVQDNGEWSRIQDEVMGAFVLAKEKTLTELERLLEKAVKQIITMEESYQLYELMKYIQSFEPFFKKKKMKFLFHQDFTSVHEGLKQFKQTDVSAYEAMNKLLFRFYFKYACSYQKKDSEKAKTLSERPLFAAVLDLVLYQFFEEHESKLHLSPTEIVDFFSTHRDVPSLLAPYFHESFFFFLQQLDKIDPFLTQWDLSYQAFVAELEDHLPEGNETELQWGLDWFADGGLWEKSQSRLGLLSALVFCLGAFF